MLDPTQHSMLVPAEPPPCAVGVPVGALIEALADSLAATAFIAVMPAEPPVLPPADGRRIMIDFAEAGGAGRRGSLDLVTSGALGQTLAANILGVGPDDQEAQSYADDALKELLNVVCGSVLRSGRRLPGDEPGQASAAEYDLSLPRIVPLDAGECWDELVSAPGTAVVDAEGQPIALRVVASDCRN